MTDTTDTTAAIDLENEPALREIVDKIRNDRRPWELKINGRAVAIIAPRRTERDRPINGRHAAFLRSAGSLKGLVDRDEMLKIIYEGRRREYYPEADE